MHHFMHANRTFLVWLNGLIEAHAQRELRMHGTSNSALAERLRQVADLFSSRESAAKAAGVSYPQLNRYLNGTTKIPLIVAIRLAEPHAISIDWIANGLGDMTAGSHHTKQDQATQRVLQVTKDIELLLARDGLSIPRSKRNDLVRTIVDMATEHTDDDARGINLERYSDVIRLVAKG